MKARRFYERLRVYIVVGEFRAGGYFEIGIRKNGSMILEYVGISCNV